MAKGYFEVIPPDDDDILLGEGYFVYDYGVTNTVMGATRGGSKVEIERVVREMPFDGAYGKYFDLRRFETYEPKFMINFLKLNYTLLTYGVPSTVTDMTTYQRIQFNLNIEDTDYLSNIAFVGKKHSGKACIIILENCLNDGNISWEHKEKDEVVAEMQYTSHYLRTALTTPTIKIFEYESAA